ncbi:MAG: hypothetical protein JW797_14420 [Bradymonadales bacterium]|nr:hypothetical protein [Bradymonadales bacterium]
MDHLENLVDLLILLLFFIVAPIVRRFTQGRQAKRPSIRPSRRPPTSEQEEIEPLPWVEEQEVTLADQIQLLLDEVQRQREQIDHLLAGVTGSRLGDLEAYRPLARWLQAATSRPLTAAIAAIDERLKAWQETPPTDPTEVLALLDRVLAEQAASKRVEALLSAFTSQRLNANLSPLLEHLDELVEALVTGGGAKRSTRRRLVLIWDGDPTIPSALLGSPEIGAVVLPRRHLSRVSGWSQLVFGLGLDLVSSNAQLMAEISRRALIGPLADRSPKPPYVASAQFDLAVAFAAWSPCLVADLIGTQLLGPAYAYGLIHSQIQSGLTGTQAATVRTLNGLYHPEPPVVIRLAVIETQLSIGGWGGEQNLVSLLAQRAKLPAELLYALPTYLASRLALRPVLEFARKAALALAHTRFAALGQRYPTEVIPSQLRNIEPALVRSCRRQFLRGERPAGSPLLLLAGAILAQSDPAAADRSFIQPLLEALTARHRDAAAMVAQKRPGGEDPTLVRDALIFGEVVWGRPPFKGGRAARRSARTEERPWR